MAKITGITRADEVAREIGYNIGYIIGTTLNLLMWGAVGAILTVIGYCILH